MYTLCLYYSRTGTTEKLIREIAQELGCEMVKLDDGVDRSGLRGWLRSGMQAMSRRLPPVKKPKTALPLGVYDLVIIGTPVWAGRCSAPVRSFLMEYGEELRRVAYVITRGSEEHYEAVFEQMDLYVRAPHVSAVSIRPNAVGSAFWRDEFLTSIRGGKEGTAMLDKLKIISDRYEALASQLEDPATYGNPDLLRRLTREQKELEPVVEAYRAYGQAERSLSSAQELLGDPELKEMAQEEIQAAKADMERLREELKLLLLPKDPNDSRNVVMEIRGGVGGEEAMLFAADLFRMYVMYVESRGWKLEVVGRNETELGGLKEISFLVEGEGAWSRLKFESGTHRVQRVPVTESSGRIQTSAATVAVLPEAEEVEFNIDPNDLKIDTFRSSGAGGQHINKTESAIRITHLPTGVVVECQDERSQYKNKDRAMKILRSKLYEAEQEKQNAAIAAQRRSQVGSGDRSERIRTYNFPQGRVTDHRLTGDVKNFSIDSVINGGLDPIIDALVTADQAAKLAEAGE